eukprot:scaffold14195_cov155-Skeletonema_dohrnii-CCMP3373.AAC.17
MYVEGSGKTEYQYMSQQTQCLASHHPVPTFSVPRPVLGYGCGVALRGCSRVVCTEQQLFS